jgi:DNA-binding protein H-NS
MALTDDLEPLVDFLRDILTPEEWEGALTIIASIESGDATVATDRKRKLTADSFAWVMREGRRLEQKSRIEAGNKRLATVQPAMAMDGAFDTMIDTDREFIRELRLQQARTITDVTDKTTVGGTYRKALRQMGLDAADLPAEAAKAMFDALQKKPRARAAMVTDAKTIAARTERFPHADRLNKGFY